MSGEIHSESPWVASPLPISHDGWVQIGDGEKIYWDQLTQSDQEKIIQYMLSAQVPILVPPQENTAVTNSDGNIAVYGKAQMIADISLAQHEIIKAMLDGWLKSIQEQAERSKKDDERRAIDRIAEAYSSYQHAVNMQTDPNFPLFAAGLIIAGTGIYQTLVPVNNTLGLEFNPVIDMSTKNMVPVLGDMRAELGWIGAMYAASLQYYTLAQIAPDVVGGKAKPNELEFAKGYAENVVKLIGDANFNSFLMALVTRGTAEGEPLSEERVKELTSMVKLVLLSSALAALYRAEAGKMTSLEFLGMLNGEIKFTAGDIRATLIALVKGHLQLLSPSIRESVLNSLGSFFDSNPDAEVLTNPAKVFSGIYGALPRGDLEI